jgi:hypothetical protein
MTKRIASLIGLLLLLLVLTLYARHLWTKFASFTIDDAAITYAYSHNLAHGHGFRHTPNTNPVEGFSNPLEVLLLVPFVWVGANLDLVAKCLNLATAIAAVFAFGILLWRRLDPYTRLWLAVPCALGFLWPTFSHWMVAGLEGGLLCGLQILSVFLLVLDPKQKGRDHALGVVALLLALTRPEGAAYGALVVGARILQSGRRWLPISIFSLGFLCILLIRYFLFLQWVPNTYYAKITTHMTMQEGWSYVHSFFIVNGRAYLLCTLPLFALLRRQTRLPALVALAQVGVALAFAVRSGGDWMRHWRFMQPMQGSFWALCLLGALAILSFRRLKHRLLVALARPVLLIASILPALYFAFPDWSQWVKVCSEQHDVDMRRIAKVADRYHQLGDRLDLGRPLLLADVDIGGMSYPPGIDVLDMGGLADLTFGYSSSRRPTDIVDYFYDYRRPDVFHMHGGWVDGRPIWLLSPFQYDFRVMGQKFMDQLIVVWLTAIRSDLVDPAVAPVKPLQAKLGPIDLLGFSSVLDPNGQQVLFVHALQVEAKPLPSLTIISADKIRRLVVWHAEYDVAPGPLGTSLLGMVRLPPTALPLEIESTGIRLTAWPDIENITSSAEALSRLPLLRSARLPSRPCHPDDFLGAWFHAGARARGLRFLAQLCGSGLTRETREKFANDVGKQASRLSSADDRYDAFRIFESLGLPTSTLQLGRIRRESDERTHFDEIALAWGRYFLKPADPSPMQIRAALGALVLARQYSEVLLTALARGFVVRAEARESLCAAMTALALQPYLLSQVPCPEHTTSRLRVTRQDFENPADPSLHFDEKNRSWFMSESPLPRFGGQGRTFLFVPPCKTPVCGEVVWGPIPWPGRHFGALLAGPKQDAAVIIEAKEGVKWIEIARTPPPVHEGILTPSLIELGRRRHTEVRVRLVNRSKNQFMTVDALTFLDLD